MCRGRRGSPAGAPRWSTGLHPCSQCPERREPSLPSAPSGHGLASLTLQALPGLRQHVDTWVHTQGCLGQRGTGCQCRVLDVVPPVALAEAQVLTPKSLSPRLCQAGKQHSSPALVLSSLSSDCRTAGTSGRGTADLSCPLKPPPSARRAPLHPAVPTCSLSPSLGACPHVPEAPETPMPGWWSRFLGNPSQLPAACLCGGWGGAVAGAVRRHPGEGVCRCLCLCGSGGCASGVCL